VDIPRTEFLRLVAELCADPAQPQSWRYE
jgi:hypothetical protein